MPNDELYIIVASSLIDRLCFRNNKLCLKNLSKLFLSE